MHQAKKHLGQNFLKSQQALHALCDAGQIEETDTIVEIGPGKGALTTHLLQKANKVIAIEMDRDLVLLLQEKFVEEIKNGKLILIHGDCLDFNYDSKYKVIANIPYNITGLILKKFLEEIENKPKNMVLVVQKEVAERIVCRDGKESILSLSVKLFSTPKYIMKVGRKFFSPAPAVDSAIIAFYDIKNVDKKYIDLFFKIIKPAFAHKRKVLKKNLESVLKKEEIEKLFLALDLDNKIRAEDIPYEEWLNIVKFLEKNV